MCLRFLSHPGVYPKNIFRYLRKKDDKSPSWKFTKNSSGKWGSVWPMGGEVR
jgi:hypothetical protein